MTSSTLEEPARRGRRPLAILALLAALAVGAVALIYVAFFNNDAPARLALSDQPSTAPTTSAAGATGAGTTAVSTTDVTGTWRPAAGSEAGYRVREKLAALRPRATPWAAARR